MNVIDYRIPFKPNPFPIEYIKNCWVRIMEMGYKSWLEAPLGEAEVPGLDPILDITADIAWRGVHGYISFGFIDGATSSYLEPKDVIGNSKVWGGSHVMWQAPQFINWRENYFEPPPVADLMDRMHRPNAIRIWLRPKVRAFVHFNIAEFEPFDPSAQIYQPGTRNLLYDSKNPNNLVPPVQGP